MYKTPCSKLGNFTHCVLTRGNLVAQRYGDDNPVLGTRREVREFREGLPKHFLLKSRGIFAPGPSANDIRGGQFLRTHCPRIEIDADPPHRSWDQ